MKTSFTAAIDRRPAGEAIVMAIRPSIADQIGV
jgi:hypothetical protein